MHFTDRELEFLRSQRLARIATVSASGVPDVAAVGFTFDGERVLIGGINNPVTFKFRNVRNNGRAAIVFDDIEPADPAVEGARSNPRGIKLHGTAEIITLDGREVIAFTPQRKWSWGINQPTFQPTGYVIEREG